MLSLSKGRQIENPTFTTYLRKQMNIIIPVSGGIDSAYLIDLAKSKGYTPHLIAIDYGNKNTVEFTAIHDIANHHNLPITLLPIPSVDLLTVKYDWQFSSSRQQEAHEGGSPYWSGYKCLMYAVCLAYGGAIGADEIWFGVYEWNDHYIDELPESAYDFQETWALLYPELKVPLITFPLLGSTKADIIRNATSLGTPLHLTWSCFHYENGNTPCGTCPGCVHRAEGFSSVMLPDPLLK